MVQTFFFTHQGGGDIFSGPYPPQGGYVGGITMNFFLISPLVVANAMWQCSKACCNID